MSEVLITLLTILPAGVPGLTYISGKEVTLNYTIPPLTISVETVP